MAKTVEQVQSVEDLLGRCTPNQIVTPFVKRYGRPFAPQKLPKHFRRGGLMVCFANSYRMAIRHNVVYVEGYAVANNGHGYLHAWCIDGNGNVLDRTWGNGLAYFGIPFQTQFLRRTIDARRRGLGDKCYFGLLDDWEAGHPLIRELGDMPELWLETLPKATLRLVR